MHRGAWDHDLGLRWFILADGMLNRLSVTTVMTLEPDVSQSCTATSGLSTLCFCSWQVVRRMTQALSILLDRLSAADMVISYGECTIRWCMSSVP